MKTGTLTGDLSHDRSVRLAPPGAGLPPFERLIGKLITGVRAVRASRGDSSATFARERDRILSLESGLSRGLSRGLAGRPVLIRRLRGMEDSSRGWSVWMTMDHLRIVNIGTADLIAMLAAGKTPSRVTGTADVKPDPAVDGSVVGTFREACSRFEATVESVADLRTRTRWPHPWFGPMNAAKWHFFAGFHMALHRRQIEAIIAGLSGASASG